MEPIYFNLLGELASGQSMALATILRTTGSTPQVPGSSAIFSSYGRIAGTLGGGILEYEAENLSKKALKNGSTVMLEYDLNADIRDQTGAICGGHALILVDPHPEKSESVFQELKIAYEDRSEGALITTGSKHKSDEWEIARYWACREEFKDHLPENLRPVQKSILRAIQEGVPLMIHPADNTLDQKESETFIFIEPILPPEQLVMVGAGHIGKAVIHQAMLLGFKTTLIDNRAEIVEKKELPSKVNVLIGEVGAQFRKLTIDQNTFVVIATQGHQHDADALRSCIHSKAAYIGLMGSRRKIRLMRERFIEEGWATAREFDNIHAPIGLDIQSETIQEIAISIAAELIKVRKDQRKKRKIPNVTCLILAAGESKRMKKQKLLMDYRGESFIRTILRKVSASQADRTLVVLGSHSREIIDEIRSFRVDTVYNTLYKEGMLSSIQCGFNSVSKNVDAVMVLLGDQPMVDTEIINQLIERYRKTGDKIIIPVFRGKRGHPVLIDTQLKDEIFTLNPEKGLRELMYLHQEDVYELEVDAPGILKDIDNMIDYKNEII